MRLNKDVKVDVLVCTTAVVTSVTSSYYSMRDYNKAMFVWTVCQVASDATSTGTVWQAKDGSAATSGTALASTTATLSVHTKCTRFTVTPSASAQTSAITITTYDKDGNAATALTFTGTPSLGTAGNTTASRLVAVNDSANGTAIISTAITNFALLMNDATYGLLNGAYASAASTPLTVRSLDGGDTSFTFTSSNTTTFTVAVDEATGVIEIDASAMTLASDFTHLALNITNSTSCHTSAYLIRGGSKRKVREQIAADITEL